MNTYTVTFRTIDGNVRYAWVNAHNENEARAIFLSHYDGRIICIELS